MAIQIWKSGRPRGPFSYDKIPLLYIYLPRFYYGFNALQVDGHQEEWHVWGAESNYSNSYGKIFQGKKSPEGIAFERFDQNNGFVQNQD